MENQRLGYLEQLSKAAPAILYHYTSLEAFHKIVSTGTLWATDIRFMNDSTEFRLAFSTLKSRIRDLRAEASEERSTKLDRLNVALESVESVGAFVSCFSTKRDDLSQWRGYTPLGRGVCIGFTTAAIREAFDTTRPMSIARQRMATEGVSLLGEVMYLSSDPQSIFDDLIEFFCGQQEQSGSPFDWLKFAARTFLIAAPFYKNAHFAEECEWRLVGGRNPSTEKVANLNFRQGASTLIPYSEINLKERIPRFISEVIIGPSPNIALTLASAKMLLDHHELADVEVIKSAIPFRNW